MGVEQAGPLRLSERDTAVMRAAALFRGLGNDALHTLLTGAWVRNLDPGGILFLQGEAADRFFLLLDGWIKLYRLSADGSETIVTIVAPGETFADAASFGSGAYPVCAEAVTPARALGLSLVVIRSSIQDNPDIAFAMLGSLSFRLRHLVEQIEQLQMKSAAQRLAAFLLRLCPQGGPQAPGGCALSLPLPKALIARRLGMRPETFSRAMLSLRKVGVIQQGATVEISEIVTLRAFIGSERDGPCA
ncbi:MAG: Crp/Fnr family transcriptional regulator [Rhodospirillales bacterium]|nr:Crp/Fnr family transcriptional regulator [Rhodospirillales bacterium]